MVRWHHRLTGHEFEQALRVRDGQGSLACCSPWGRKELDATEKLNRIKTDPVINVGLLPLKTLLKLPKAPFHFDGKVQPLPDPQDFRGF